MLLRANVLRAGLVAVVAALVLGGVQGTAVLRWPGWPSSRSTASSWRRSRPGCRTPPTTPSLVSANALSTTSGAVATVVGGGAAIALLQLDRLRATPATPRWRWRRRCPTWPPRPWSPGSGAATWGPTTSPARRGCRPRDVARRHGGRRAARVGAPARRRGAAGDQPAPALLRRPDADDAAAVPEHVRAAGGAVPRRARRARRGARRRRGRHPAGRRRHAAGVVRRIGKPRWITLLLAGAGVAAAGAGPAVPGAARSSLAGLVLGSSRRR